MAIPKQTHRNEIIRKFKSLGWEGPSSKKDKRKGGTDHQFMRKGKRTVKILNPHGGQDIGKPLLKKILDQAGINEGEWEKA